MSRYCTVDGCGRAAMRVRGGLAVCMYHPAEQPPPMDMLSGILRGPDGKPKRTEPAPARAPRAPRTPAAARAPRPPRPSQPARARAARPVAAAPADGLCDVGDCPRPWRHRGVHTHPKEQAPDHGGCLTPGCTRAWKHYGPHTTRPPRPSGPAAPGLTPTPFDAADAARRYLDGRPLFALAADLGIGVARLRAALRDQGVQIRGRGEVVGQRGRAARPIDPDEAVRLYQSGMDSVQVARALQVQQLRVQDVLRARGVLKRRRGATAAPLDLAEARRLYATGLTTLDVARKLGVRTGRVQEALRASGDLRAARQRATGAA